MIIKKYETRMDSDNQTYLICENKRILVSAVTMDEQACEIVESVFELSRRAEEHLCVVMLNTKGVPKGVIEVSMGAVDLSVFPVREIMSRCLLADCARFICIHNHPSGDTSFSKDDISSCSRMKQAAEFVGMKMLDFITIAKSNSKQGYSFLSAINVGCL